MSEPTLGRALLKLWAISDRLKVASIRHEVLGYRRDAISIVARVPGEYWEVDICDDGNVQVEIFTSQEPLRSADELETMIKDIESWDQLKGSKNVS